jgi:steroid 5-alpha reductase family enzyme
MYFEAFGILFLYFFLIFIIGQIIKDNSIVDIGWGSGFVLSAIFTFFRAEQVGIKGILITSFITIWGLRLTYHLAKRNLGKPEDYRYVQMRARWGRRHVLIKAFFNVYFLQFIIQAIVTLPVIYGNSSLEQEFLWFNWFGVLLWGIGFFFEAVGDYQLKVFKKNPQNRGELMKQGLWSFTRHPNYFGDSGMWFGIFFMAISEMSGLWIIVSPLLMTFFLVFVSGVRLLEKKYEGREDFERYKKETNAFIPWFPKK